MPTAKVCQGAQEYQSLNSKCDHEERSCCQPSRIFMIQNLSHQVQLIFLKQLQPLNELE